jgi:hypothetical protein
MSNGDEMPRDSEGNLVIRPLRGIAEAKERHAKSMAERYPPEGLVPEGTRTLSMPDPKEKYPCDIEGGRHEHQATRIDWIRFRLGTGPEPGTLEWRVEQHFGKEG